MRSGLRAEQGEAMKSDIDAVSVAMANHGLVTRELLRHAGMSDQRINRWLRSGQLRSMGSTVYQLFETPGDRWTIAAAVLSIKGSAADLHTAAKLHGLAMPQPECLPQIVVPRSGTNRSGLAEVRQSGHLPSDDICVVDGIRSLTIARTVCELVPMVGPFVSERLISSALSQTELTESELQACDMSLARRGRPGVQHRRSRLGLFLTGEDTDLTVLERRFLLSYQTTDLPPVQAQYRPPWFDGIKGIADFGLEGWRVIIEVDGRAWHSSIEARDEDARRDRRAMRHGWRVLRFSWDEVVHRWAEVESHLRFVLDPSSETLDAG